MDVLNCEARLQLPNLEQYLDLITDRIRSFDAGISGNGERIDFSFAFGAATFEMKPGLLVLRAGAGDRDGLARIKDILASAVEIYARQDVPEIAWTGDLAGDTRLAQFREMTVTNVIDLTPHMRRIRLAGEDLARFGKFQGMHVRILFPTAAVPDPIWPSLGANGLPVWPSDDRRPTARVYTIRALDLRAGHMDVDFLLHEGESVGSAWAIQARAGQKVGIMGPVGRPVRSADWYVLGADETGLPAVGRLLETLPSHTKGVAFVEIADSSERQQINNVTQIELCWLERDGKAPGTDGRLAEQILSARWPENGTAFGWFAAEAEAAKLVRTTWRDQMGLGRDQTIAAAYWRRGQAGLMAG